MNYIPKHAAVTPTQVASPWRATLRTAAQTFLAVLLALGAITPVLQDFVAEVAPGSPVLGIIAAASGIAAALAAAITRIMALEKVNDLLTRLGLGAAPKDAGTYSPGVSITDLTD